MPELRAQRTLVKSPPELWAQVSDPVSLSRHLGEFGEIRITRIVPEQTVAWEGERASGTVELSSSGWGTKVTLVAQLVDDTDPASQPEPPAADASPTEPPGGEATPTTARPADAFELINSLARQPLARTPLPLDADEAEAEADEAEAEAEPGAAVEAAVTEPPVLTDAPQEHADPPRGEPVEEPDKAAVATADQEQGPESDAWFSQLPGTVGAAVEPHASHAATTPEGTRRGFFARLFSKRRDATPQPTELAQAAQPNEHHDLAAAAPGNDPEVAVVEADATSTEHDLAAVAADAAPGAHEAAAIEAEAAPEDELEQIDAEAAPEDEVQPIELEPEPDPEPEAEPEPEPELEPAASASEPDEDAPHAAEVAPLDPARAEAVLTAVLDDLGAARHRPFSRA